MCAGIYGCTDLAVDEDRNSLFARGEPERVTRLEQAIQDKLGRSRGEVSGVWKRHGVGRIRSWVGRNHGGGQNYPKDEIPPMRLYNLFLRASFDGGNALGRGPRFHLARNVRIAATGADFGWARTGDVGNAASCRRQTRA